jgi:hypothetical protein
MSDPHVVALRYRLETDPSLIFDRPAPREDDTPAFALRLANGLLTCDMKAHFPSVAAAKAAVDPFLQAWELNTALREGRRALWFAYEDAELIDRHPSPAGSDLRIHVSEGTLRVTGAMVSLRVTRREYPAPPERFLVSPDVETLWQRYEGYVQGREPLPGMAYVCQSFIEKVLARGQPDAANKYHIERKVLHTLGNLHSHRGDLTSRRKLEHERDRHEPPLTPQEIAWMEAAVRILIRRVGEYAADPTAPWPTLSMRDLPPL